MKAPRDEAARRLGAPYCRKCKRVGAIEESVIFGDKANRQYISVDYCAPCAEGLRKMQTVVDEVNRVSDLIDRMSTAVTFSEKVVNASD